MKLRQRMILAAGALLGLLATGQAMATCTLEATAGTEIRNIGSRSYRLHVPAGLTGAQVPLLVSLHGGNEPASTYETQTGWSGYADQNNFIVAYPMGINNVWDYAQGGPDVGFVRQVADDIAATYCVDPKRTFVDGYSNGALLSQRMACDAGDQFASATSYGGGSPTLPNPNIEGPTSSTPCEPSRPIGVAMFWGALDPLQAGAQQDVDEWVALNGCNTTASTTYDTQGMTRTYSGCAAGVKVLWRTLYGNSHDWPMGSAGTDLKNRMWNFLMAHPKP